MMIPRIPGTRGKKRRIKIGIRPQLIILVCFSSLFSLLILAVVIGVYVSQNTSDLRADRLQVIAQLKATQIKQSMQFLYYQVSWLSQRDTITSPLSYYRAGNISALVFDSSKSALDLFLTTSETFASARLYDLSLSVVAESHNTEVSISEPVEDALYPLGTSTDTGSAALLSNASNAVPTGFMTGPLSNTTNLDSFFLGITVPVFGNSSIIVNQQQVTGFLTVIASADSIKAALTNQVYSEDYSSVVLRPVYANDTPQQVLIGFLPIFSTYTTFIGVSNSPAADYALSRPQGTATKVRSLAGGNVAIGFFRIQIDSNTSWTIIIEQPRRKFLGPVKRLTDIMIGVVIGIGAFMCLLTFPLAVGFVRPITRLKDATESITRSKKEKKFNADMRAYQSDLLDADKSEGSLQNKRNSMNTIVSSGSSTAYSTGIRLPDRIPQSKNLFKDELTELSEAFNIMTEELEKQYGHLEDRVKVRTKELEASKIEAEAANEAKTVFIANISHELRTPLNGILGMTSIAMDETDHNLIQDSLKLIHRSGELLLHILTELLTYSKNTLNRSKLEKSNFQILEVIYQVKSIFSKLAQDQRVKFKISLKPTIFRKLIVLGDSNRIIQVVMNLVSNSLKFTPVDGSVDVSFKILGEYDYEASKAVNFEKVCLKENTAMNLNEKSQCPEDDLDHEESRNSPGNCRAAEPLQRQDSNKTRRTETSTTEKLMLEPLSDIHSITTLSTSEYEENIFQAQFSRDKPLPGLPQFNPSAPQSYKHFEGDLDDKDVGIIDKSSQLHVKPADGLSEDVDFKPPLKPDLPHNESTSSYSSQCFNNELVKNNKVYKMRKIYAPKHWVIQIEVKDTGSGIEPALQEKVFEPFIQGDQTLSRSYGGTGLGLSICRQLAKMMHGTLTLKSTIGQGSTFIFTLPLKQSGEIVVPPNELEQFCDDEFNPDSKMNRKVEFSVDPPGPDTSYFDKRELETPGNTNGQKEQFLKPPVPHAPPRSSSTGTVNQNLTGDTCLDDLSHLSILVAEDNKVNQEVIRRMLKLEGFHNITMAANGAEAVDLVNGSFEKMALFDMIFMDVQMPKMDGLTATKIIRNTLKFQNPIIALTAFADASNVKECLNSGMSGFLSKPIKRSNLKKIFTEICPDLFNSMIPTPNTIE